MSGTFRVLMCDLHSRNLLGNQVHIDQNTIVNVGINPLLPGWVMLRDGNGSWALVRNEGVGEISEPIFKIGVKAFQPTLLTANIMAVLTVELDPVDGFIANDVVVCDTHGQALHIAAGSRVIPVAFTPDGLVWFKTVNEHAFVVDWYHPGDFARATPDLNANNQQQGNSTAHNALPEPAANPADAPGTLPGNTAPAEPEAITTAVSVNDDTTQSVETPQGGEQAREDESRNTDVPAEVNDSIDERQSEPIDNGSSPSAPPERDFDGQNVMDDLESPELGEVADEELEAPNNQSQNDIELAMWSPAALMANGVSEETLDYVARTVQSNPMVHDNNVDPNKGCMLCLLFHDYGQCPFLRFGR